MIFITEPSGMVDVNYHLNGNFNYSIYKSIKFDFISPNEKLA